MQTSEIIIEKLLVFKRRNKFSLEAWNNRGLNPSSEELCIELSKLFNKCSDDLIEALNNKTFEKQSTKILSTSLKELKKAAYDTEEKEFICDLFNELAVIINIDFKRDLNVWLYGVVFNKLFNIKNALSKKRVVETRSQACSKCGVALEIYITKTQNGIPEMSWLIVKCNNCEELNILSYGPNVKEMEFGNYEMIDQFRMDDYSEKSALLRLEQMKFFRK